MLAQRPLSLMKKAANKGRYYGASTYQFNESSQGSDIEARELYQNVSYVLIVVSGAKKAGRTRIALKPSIIPRTIIS